MVGGGWMWAPRWRRCRGGGALRWCVAAGRCRAPSLAERLAVAPFLVADVTLPPGYLLCKVFERGGLGPDFRLYLGLDFGPDFDVGGICTLPESSLPGEPPPRFEASLQGYRSGVESTPMGE